MLKEKKLVIIGVGKMGEALILGLLKKGDLEKAQICGTVRHEISLARVKDRLGIAVSTDNRQSIEGCDIIILAVKPQNMDQVLQEIASTVTAKQLIISIATSISTTYIQERLGKDVPVVRAMPNTPSIYNAGMTGLCGGLCAGSPQIELAKTIFAAVGRTVFIDESLMDAVTALSASGPAYLYVVVESLVEAGVKLGIPREEATLLAAQTMFGAAHMILESKEHPALLKDMVTTPAGCTVDGLMELEEGKLRVTLIKAVVKAAERARELVNTQDGKK